MIHRALADKKIVYHTSHDQQKRANGAFLITAFAIIHLKKNAEEAYQPVMGIQPPFAPFKDVYGGSWNNTIIDCCRAVYKAQLLGWLNFETFNVQEYEVALPNILHDFNLLMGSTMRGSKMEI